MKKDFEKFEDLAAMIYESLSSQGYSPKRNVRIEGPDGERQIDVLIEGKVGPIDVRTIIECKDYASKVNVTKVDELHSKMQDVKAHVGILVSRKGFTKGAIQKAKRLGIKLNTIHQSKSDKWDFEFDVPILIEEIWPSLSFTMDLTLDEGQSIRTDKLIVNDIDILEVFTQLWNRCQKADVESSWLLEIGIHPPYYITDPNSGVKHYFKDIDLNVSIKRKFFLGNLRELENSYLLNEILESRITVMVNTQQLGEYRVKFAEYDDDSQIPNPLVHTIKAFSKPSLGEENFQGLHFDVVGIDKNTGEESPFKLPLKKK